MQFCAPPTPATAAFHIAPGASTLAARTDAVTNYDPPNFWVEPETGVQPLTVAEFAEEDWLREPNPDLGGKTPSELLEGTTRDREALENTISAMENAISAINDGAFS